MLTTERTDDFLDLDVLGHIPVSQTFPVDLYFTSLTDKRFSSAFEFDETDIADRFFCLLWLALFFFVVNYRHSLYCLKELLGWWLNSCTTLNLELLTVYRDLLELFDPFTLFAIGLMLFFHIVGNPLSA
jgi:hypothetical protein